MCKFCGCVVYCSSTCLKNDVDNHAEECNLLVNNAGTLRYFVDDKVRLLVRIHLKSKVKQRKQQPQPIYAHYEL